MNAEGKKRNKEKKEAAPAAAAPTSPLESLICRELGDVLDLGSSLWLSYKAPRLVLGVDTPIPKPSTGWPRVDPSEKPGQCMSTIAVYVGVELRGGYHGMGSSAEKRRFKCEHDSKSYGARTESKWEWSDTRPWCMVGVKVKVKIVISEMSSEETLSVGGGEEVRSFSWSSSSSFSGKSGGMTSISGANGGQEDSIVPTTILEVGGSRARCYDEREKVVGEVRGYNSCWRSRGELGHLVENYNIPPHVLVRPVGSEERACSALKDHWMLLYVHYLAVGLQFPIPELLVALLKEYGLGLTQLVPNGVQLVGGSGKEKGWFYFIPQVVGGRSRNLFTAGPFSIKGWKEKFFFVNDAEWGRGDGEVEELNRWKGKRRNPNQYRLREVEKDKVEMLERGGGELTNIMYLTSPEVVESSGIYGRSSLSRGMNHLRDGGKAVQLPEKRSNASASGAQEERVRGGTSRPHLGGGPRVEVGPSSEPRKGSTEEVTARKRPRVEVVAPGRDEVASNGGSGVVRQALEYEELSRQKEEAEKNFGDLTSKLEKVREELATSKRAAELEEQTRKNRKKVKSQNPEVDMTNITFGLEEAGVEENGDSKTAEFRLEVKLTWERDEAGKTILPPTLDFELVAINEDEAEVAPRTEVADNVRDEEVD
ncbi:hypothetical protein SLEP1_g1851 [Rubroshorea leprosula]|uniref:Uncharacterized protein n=1 Tax=Rubroshorea leprosula TaxID=152421 RepID=A0AAV5HL24_9ROSI|nr:hypothetical protein SLEP1_g1851 [Rubroshorea leprosula]